MPLPSQNLKKSSYISALPEYWSEEDKTNYELLVADAKRYFPYMNDYIIHIGVVAEINRVLGKGEELDVERAKELREKYKDTNLEYITPYDPDFDFKATMEDILLSSNNIEVKDDEINKAN